MGYDAAEEEQWRVYMLHAEEDTMIVKVRSPTSEMYPEVKETDKVRDLAKIIEQAWGNDPMILRHNGVEMQSDQPLSVYNVRDGSVVKVSVLAEPPYYPQPKYLNKAQEGSLPVAVWAVIMSYFTFLILYHDLVRSDL
nr:uncharacterized protein LOC109229625 [Ipomoea trifida]